MMTRRALLAGACATLLAAPGLADGPVLILGSTTTTENSGLLAFLLPKFEADTGIKTRVVVAGTGRVLQLASVGDVDVSLTHDPVGEAAIIAEGLGTSRYEVMFNDFLLVGPETDPAGIAGITDPKEALRQIAVSGALFFSRGDDSGTHRRERALWGNDVPTGDWYRETGAGMGATLNIAVASDGYALVDRGSWAAFGNRGNFAELVSGVESLRNQYGIILPTAIRPEAAPAANDFINWMITAPGQSAIAAFRINGEQVFTPNAAD